MQYSIHDGEVVPVVEAERKLVQVQREILRGDFVIDAHDGPLEQRPDILDPIDMDWAIHIGLSMIHSPVRILGTIKPEIRGEAIGMDFSSRLRMLTNELGQGAARDILYGLHSDVA